MKKDDATFFKKEFEHLCKDLDKYTVDDLYNHLTRLRNILKPLKNDSIEELNCITDLIYVSKFLIEGAKETDDIVTINKNDLNAFKRALLKLKRIKPKQKMDENIGDSSIVKYNMLGMMRGDMW